MDAASEGGALPEERRVCAPKEVPGQPPPARCAVLESMCIRVCAPAHVYGCTHVHFVSVLCWVHTYECLWFRCARVRICECTHVCTYYHALHERLHVWECGSPSSVGACVCTLAGACVCECDLGSGNQFPRCLRPCPRRGSQRGPQCGPQHGGRRCPPSCLIADTSVFLHLGAATPSPSPLLPAAGPAGWTHSSDARTLRGGDTEAVSPPAPGSAPLPVKGATRGPPSVLRGSARLEGARSWRGGGVARRPLRGRAAPRGGGRLSPPRCWKRLPLPAGGQVHTWEGTHLTVPAPLSLLGALAVSRVDDTAATLTWPSTPGLRVGLGAGRPSAGSVEPPNVPDLMAAAAARAPSPAGAALRRLPPRGSLGSTAGPQARPAAPEPRPDRGRVCHSVLG